MKRNRSTTRTFVTLIVTLFFGVAFLLVPLKSRGAKSPEAPETAALPAPVDGKPTPAGKGEPVPEARDERGGAEPALSLPTGKGLPLPVYVGIFFLELKSFDDNKSEFECTTDMRLRWTDLRLQFPKGDAYRGYREFRGKEAEDQLAKMWTPTIDVANRLEAASYVGRRVRIFPNGDVETFARVTGRYKVNVDPERFPFDRQHLLLELLVRENTTDEVALRFDKDDVEFSRVSHAKHLEGWRPGLVDLRADALPGWNGDHYSRITASLFVDRLATSSLAPIFIPLVASLLIPLLAIWMNRPTSEGFEIQAFELANMGIGGLFSVIALSFAIYSSYGVVAGSDNTVTRLFGLNYVSLALALGIVVLFFRYNLLLRFFGPYVQEQAFRFLTWAMPLLSLAMSIAFMLVAAL
ncbi:hypothetical protein AKJ09_05345 [Labilithrix luteola]|uniref:Neurotransmitter-gated ion-channel ligand-binding domain-containing protein n=1 Tax=Labilithrix luteola TaxID=1391654 RepID=A0A0K1PZ56_9BACT|nr:hypothetical protein [Labilithrix luteola]AKU98681.1 hypothetical protein AKJ09_05345 [Labilithrix luteola]